MGNEVYANCMELSCKAGQGKSVCAFPDVCFTPPLTPATPPGVPIPYPNTGMTSDTSDGSKTVQVSGQEVMLKDKSCFKQSTGDEAGSAPKKNVITSKIKGKVYFNAWSMDVKFEGENVVRNLDLTTHNHASKPGATPPWPFMDAMAPSKDPCKNEKGKEEKACGGLSPKKQCRDSACQKARKCKLVKFKDKKGSPKCCKPQVAHHIIPNSLVQGTRGRSATNVGGMNPAYTLENAPCVCCSGKSGVSTPIGTHKKMHDLTKAKLQSILKAGKDITYEDVRAKAAEAHRETFKGSDGKPACTAKCIEAQIDNHMKGPGDSSPKVLQKDGATSTNYAKYKIGKKR